MPTVSKKQRRAMQAAVRGQGRTGIPVRVAKEFLAADRRKKRPRHKTVMEKG